MFPLTMPHAVSVPYAATYRAHRQALGEHDRHLYDAIDQAVARFEGDVLLPAAGTFGHAFDLYQMVAHDVCDYVHLSCSAHGSVDDASGDVRLALEYRMSAHEVQWVQHQMERRAARLLRGIDRSASQAEIALQVHDALLRDFSFDKDCHDEEGHDDAHFACGALLGRCAVCDGYARAYKYLLDRMGIRSAVVWGQAGRRGDRENHAWAVVDMSDAVGASPRWRNVDITWDGSASFHGMIAHPFFGLGDAQMAETHQRTSPGFDGRCQPGSFYVGAGRVLPRVSDVEQIARSAGYPKRGLEIQLPTCSDADERLLAKCVARRLRDAFDRPVRHRFIPEQRVALFAAA